MMLRPFKALKVRLSSVSDRSLRYRMVNEIFKEETIDKSKACTFYWVLMPSALAALFALGFFTVIVYGVFVPIGWLFGYHPVPTSDKKIGQLKIGVRESDLFLPRRYTFKSNSYRRHSPIFYITPVAVVGAVIWKMQSVGLERLAANTGDVVTSALPVVLALFVSVIGVGLLIAQLRGQLRGFWIRVCPPLEVKHDVQPEKAS